MSLDHQIPHQSENNVKTLSNLAWGLKWGLWFALFFSLVACLMAALTGGEILERQGLSLPATIAFYVGGGCLGGAVVGLLRPLTAWKLGASLVGIVTMVPISLILGSLLYGPLDQWDLNSRMGMAMFSVLLGGLGGHTLWERRKDEP
jgi:hypothetical protein